MATLKYKNGDSWEAIEIKDSFRERYINNFYSVYISQPYILRTDKLTEDNITAVTNALLNRSPAQLLGGTWSSYFYYGNNTINTTGAYALCNFTPISFNGVVTQTINSNLEKRYNITYINSTATTRLRFSSDSNNVSSSVANVFFYMMWYCIYPPGR